MYDLKGKTILVTGGSRGIGAAVAEACASAGARVLIHYGANRRAAIEVAERCGGTADDILGADLSEPGAGAKLWAAAEAASNGGVFGLVNNAGIHDASPVFASDDAWKKGWDDVLQVNLRAAADIARAAVLSFRERGGGRMINLASRSSHRGDGLDYAAYAASKAGLLAMSKTFARALSGENILVYAITPGWVDTEMSPQDEEGRAKAVEEIPLGRMATAPELGRLSAFLLSDACQALTGATFDVNGASYVR